MIWEEICWKFAQRYDWASPDVVMRTPIAWLRILASDEWPPKPPALPGRTTRTGYGPMEGRAILQKMREKGSLPCQPADSK